MSMTKVTSGIIDTLDASKLTGALPAMDGSNLTGIDALPAAGASGNVLTSDGTNWASGAAPAGGTPVWTHINTIPVANPVEATIEFTGLNGTLYKDHKIIYSGIHSNGSHSLDLQMQFMYNGAWKTNQYYNSVDYHPANNSLQHYAQVNSSCFVVQRGSYNGPGMGMCGELNIWNSSTDYNGFAGFGSNNNYSHTGMAGWTISGGQVNGSMNDFSGIKFYWSSGASFYPYTGYFALYGRTEQ